MPNRGENLHGSQPPPAARPPAKRARAAYKRYLPHLQLEEHALFVTFSTRKRFELPGDAREIVLQHCLHDHGRKLHMHAAVVMPNHVHLLFTPIRDESGSTYGMAEIMNSIKGASSHSVNKLLGRRGTVWEAESFDRVMRRDESIREKAEYICANPVRGGLVTDEGEYPWLWREWVEGVQ
jgi:REP element-mobilizing transposase RayT